MPPALTPLHPDDEKLVNAFEAVCTALHQFHQMEDLDPQVLANFEEQALNLATGQPGILRRCGLHAARSGSRALLLAIGYDKVSIDQATFSAVLHWLTAEDVPALLDRIWVLGIGTGTFAAALAGRADLQGAFLRVFEGEAALMDPSAPHAIVDQASFALGTAEEDVGFAAQLIRMIVARHPEEASADIEIESRSAGDERLIALILAGARLLPGGTDFVSKESPVHSAHGRMAVFKKHVSLENFLATTHPF